MHFYAFPCLLPFSLDRGCCSARLLILESMAAGTVNSPDDVGRSIMQQSIRFRSKFVATIRELGQLSKACISGAARPEKSTLIVLIINGTEHLPQTSAYYTRPLTWLTYVSGFLCTGWRYTKNSHTR